GIVLDPARLWKMLGKLLGGAAGATAGPIVDQGTGAGGPLVDGQQVRRWHGEGPVDCGLLSWGRFATGLSFRPVANGPHESNPQSTGPSPCHLLTCWPSTRGPPAPVPWSTMGPAVAPAAPPRSFPSIFHSRAGSSTMP